MKNQREVKGSGNALVEDQNRSKNPDFLQAEKYFKCGLNTPITDKYLI